MNKPPTGTGQQAVSGADKENSLDSFSTFAPVPSNEVPPDFDPDLNPIRSQRDKGARRERELVAKHLEIGVHAERVPLSGAAHYRGADHDIDIYIFGEDAGALVAEVKARKSGEGFKTLESWLGENDLLFLVRDRQDPLVVLPWKVWELILGRVRP